MANIPDDIFSVSSSVPMQGAKRVLILTADGTEDIEFFYPYYRFAEAGYRVDVVTPDGKAFKGKNGYEFKDTAAIESADADRYEMLYIPGGKAPEKLKKSDEALQIVKAFVLSGKPVGAICHGPQLLAKAGVIAGKRIAAWPECQSEVEEAGASWQDKECVQDGQFITARWPADLPAQMGYIIDMLQSGAGSARSAA